VMGIMYHFSKNNIFVPITIHFINNLLAAIGILVLRGLA
jgi:membrane protease YdiL (CAAX protease family)